MTTLTARTKPRAAAGGSQTSARADAVRISRPEYQALLQAYLSIALLSVAAMGIVALKSAILISHFNYYAMARPTISVLYTHKETWYE